MSLLELNSKIALETFLRVQRETSFCHVSRVSGFLSTFLEKPMDRALIQPRPDWLWLVLILVRSNAQCHWPNSRGF